jgi:hypothetical protein
MAAGAPRLLYLLYLPYLPYLPYLCGIPRQLSR